MLILEGHPTAFFGSPLLVLVQEFRKDGARMRVMKTWSLEELEAARHLFPGVSHDRLCQLFSMFGGDIRHCLALALHEDAEAMLMEAICYTNIHTLLSAIGRPELVRNNPW